MNIIDAIVSRCGSCPYLADVAAPGIVGADEVEIGRLAFFSTIRDVGRKAGEQRLAIFRDALDFSEQRIDVRFQCGI